MAGIVRRIKVFAGRNKRIFIKLSILLVITFLVFYAMSEGNTLETDQYGHFERYLHSYRNKQKDYNISHNSIRLKLKNGELDNSLAIYNNNESLQKKRNNRILSGRLNPENPAINSIKGHAQALESNKDKLNANFKFHSRVGARAHEEIMSILEMDKVHTFEVDMSKVVRDKDVKFPKFVEFANDTGPGEHGRSFVIKSNSLSKEERSKKSEDFKLNNFDVWVSDRIALHRRLDDRRNERCLQQVYHATTLPSCSVVIVFYNEALSTLLRSIHSIIDRSPKEALVEIILFDDGSDQDHLKTPLEVYIKPLKIIRLIRATKRLGLIKARNLGFLYAKGEIIIFLDSHIECFPGWLEPLVAPIVLDPKTVTFPLIPVIDKNSFAMNKVSYVTLGTMRVHNMEFKRMKKEEQQPFSQLYYDSPTMPGGLYAISRNWFRHLGAYDSSLILWGAENIEISLKIWMCGGKLLLSSCSFIGHVFRTKSSLSPQESYANYVSRNSLRVAEVWLDKYKHFVYEKFNYKFESFGDTVPNKRLRLGLQCRNFQWYLDNVNQALKRDMDTNGIYFGQIKNIGTGLCLYSDPFDRIVLAECDSLNTKQLWQYRTDGVLANCEESVLCLKGRVELFLMSTKWILRRGPGIFYYDQHQRLIETNKQLCIGVHLESRHKKVILKQCDESPNQMWKLQKREDMREFHKARGVTGIEW